MQPGALIEGSDWLRGEVRIWHIQLGNRALAVTIAVTAMVGAKVNMTGNESSEKSPVAPVLLPDVTLQCPNCGYQGPAEPLAPGKMWLEAVFWVAFLVPGLAYSIWRIFWRRYLCPSCKSAEGRVHIAPSRWVAMIARAVLLVAFVTAVILLLVLWQYPQSTAS